MSINRYSDTYRRNIYNGEYPKQSLNCDVLTKIVTTSGLQIYIPEVSPEQIINDCDGDFTNEYSACVDSGQWQNIDMSCYLNTNNIEVISCVNLDYFTTQSLISKINIIIKQNRLQDI